MELTTEEAQSRVALLGAHTKSLSTFFEEFTSPLNLQDEDGDYKPFGDKKYKNQLQMIKNDSSKVLKVYMDDVRQYFLKENHDKDFYEGLMMNTYRYLELLYIASEMVLEKLTKDENYPKFGLYYDPIDELRVSRMKQNKLPINLRSNYDILLVNGNDDYIMKMKYVNADFVGCLVLIEVDVFKVANISPKLLIATYECDICHNHSYKTIEGNNYMPLMDCVNCVSTRNVKSSLKFHPKLSKFEKYQEIRVQEPLVHLNEGEMPKNLKCQLTNSLVGLLRPGDNILLYGILLPMFKEGFNNNKFTLLSDKVFKILNITHLKRDFKLYKQLSNNYFQLYHWHIPMIGRYTTLTLKITHDYRKMEELSRTPNVYEILSNSIAPDIYGHQDIKKALLLQLIGGCNVVKKDGGFIRGNIHILLLGDPGVAKSQLMKRICQISTRAIYTTGKGSSSSGLTAAIVKDPVTGDSVLEGGALVLANNGVCCIDEFDKMDDEDRSAIYEVMEQQKVSVAKAGHVTTLAANSSVLAAANPLSGVYDINKSVFININLPHALLSRFDLQFLLLDNINYNNDYKLSQYKLNNTINTYGTSTVSEENTNTMTNTTNTPNTRTTNSTNTNTNTGAKDKRKRNDKSAGSKNKTNSTTDSVNNGVTRGLQSDTIVNPVASDDILMELSKWYINNRQDELQQELYQNYQYSYTTPRTILSILRLAQALARMRFSNDINMSDLEESIRLTESMKHTINYELLQQKHKRKVTTSSNIMYIIKNLRNNLKNTKENWDGWININDVEQQLLSNGYKTKDLNDFISKYSQLAIILLNSNNTQLSFPQDII
uniref:DNA helicase n=1 Tax=Theileria annulata TaxID=5874 RepID=A0A3B0NDM0_THEAN